MTSKREPLVPLAELGMERMTDHELRAWAGLSEIVVQRDYLDRPAISLDDAYRVAESRRTAEREWAESETRRLREHAEAVTALQRRVNATFVAARTEALAASVGANLWGGQTERDGLATNRALDAAREVWAAAPGAVRDEVSSVEYEDAGMTSVVPLSLSMPLELINAYAAKAARKY
jgi:hypothetical protein